MELAQVALLRAQMAAKLHAQGIAPTDARRYVVDNVNTHVEAHARMCQPAVIVQVAQKRVPLIVIGHVPWLVVQAANHAV
ncbi:MAG: hypothetical protein IJ142_00085 [Bacteroidaceae bacterium]|nr:hypothetical protein [Bacteroidaceae bacterium]